MNWSDIDNAWAFLAVLVVTVANLTVVIVGQRRGRARWRRDRELIRDIHHEAVNAHGGRSGPNMRDQIDRSESSQQTVAQQAKELRHWLGDQARDIAGIRQDIGGLRGEQRDTARELAEHRRETREFEDRVTGFARDQHPDAENPL